MRALVHSCACSLFTYQFTLHCSLPGASQGNGLLPLLTAGCRRDAPWLLRACFFVPVCLGYFKDKRGELQLEASVTPGSGWRHYVTSLVFHPSPDAGAGSFWTLFIFLRRTDAETIPRLRCRLNSEGCRIPNYGGRQEDQGSKGCLDGELSPFLGRLGLA